MQTLSSAWKRDVSIVAANLERISKHRDVHTAVA